jgi:hypothetical protein
LALFAAIAGAVGAAVGSTGPWITVAFVTLSGLDAAWWGRSALIAATVAAVALTLLLMRPSAFGSRWAVPVAWLAVVLGVGCLALSVPFLIRIVTLPREEILRITVGANPGWGLWLLVVSGAVLALAATIVARAMGLALDQRLDPDEVSPSRWSWAWKDAAVVTASLLVIASSSFHVLQWKSDEQDVKSGISGIEPR